MSALSILLVSSCVSFDYTPPIPADCPPLSRTIPVDYDSVWSALIEVVTTRFFGIENFEKDSGLMVLSFTATPISRYVDGGHFTYRQSETMDGSRRSIRFDGNYADWLENHEGGALSGRINLIAKRLSANETEVSVKARYIVTTRTSPPFAFDSGSSATVAIFMKGWDKPQPRTLQPTYLAESSILDAIGELAGKTKMKKK